MSSPQPAEAASGRFGVEGDARHRDGVAQQPPLGSAPGELEHSHPGPPRPQHGRRRGHRRGKARCLRPAEGSPSSAGPSRGPRAAGSRRDLHRGQHPAVGAEGDAEEAAQGLLVAVGGLPQQAGHLLGILGRAHFPYPDRVRLPADRHSAPPGVFPARWDSRRGSAGRNRRGHPAPVPDQEPIGDTSPYKAENYTQALHPAPPGSGRPAGAGPFPLRPRPDRHRGEASGQWRPGPQEGDTKGSGIPVTNPSLADHGRRSPPTAGFRSQRSKNQHSPPRVGSECAIRLQRDRRRHDRGCSHSAR